MSTVLKLRLDQSQMERLEREARRMGQSPSDAAARLVEESLRRREHLRIEFREGIDIRDAYVRGTRLKVWHLRACTDFRETDVASIAQEFNLTADVVSDVFTYARQDMDEIDAAVSDNRQIASSLERYDPTLEVARPEASDA